MVVVLMGVTGSGKSTVGQALAALLGWRFVGGDDFHPAANRDKMSRAEPLTDADRAPWLAALRDEIEGWLAASEDVVLACSALKRAYRQQLRVGPEVRIVYLEGSAELIERRLQQRDGHFATADLLVSQFETLETPEDDEGVIEVSIDAPAGEIAGSIASALALRAK